MARIRVPGVYFEDRVRERRDITLGETGVPAFLGVAERGPLNVPTKIQNAQHFHQVYGTPVEHSHLSESVVAFFLNGGRHCFVVRVAHIFKRGKGDLARKARYEVLDQDGYPAIEINASSEGAWGNEISLSVSQPAEPRVQTFITLDADADAHRAMLQTTRGLEPGMIVRLRDGVEERYVTLTHVRANEIFWTGDLNHLFKSSAPTYVEPVEFHILVTTRRKIERFEFLSQSPTANRNYLRVINGESELLLVKDLETTSLPPLRLPEKVEGAKLRGGRDGLDAITPEDFIGYNNGPDARFGLGSLEANEEVDLIAIPDLHYAQQHCSGFKSERDIVAVHRAMLDHCERMGDRFALLDLPCKTSFEEALDWRLKFDSAFGAIYFPWLISAENDRKAVPPCGHIAGLISKCDQKDGVHRAPANLALEGVVDTSIVLREAHLAELNNKGVNCVRSFPVRGIRPWGAKTLSSEPEWRYITTRRIFNALRRAVYENTQWVVFENNGPDLRIKVTTAVQDFMRALWATGYFKGQTQDDAFWVQCDENNNTLEDLDAGVLVVDIAAAPSRPAEFIYMRLEHTLEDRRLGDLSEIDM
ncbi:MAG: hypothetical protein AUK47_28570 [Deltaproteobacteria bacterium CG2_30_63_29]|nr:MAG: hypothetical protein AUK47_28570 [Deltaproteobacteria bacterium CG2_30_63_29]PJB47637.1 MAG: hypothetical protein CO108_03850 [Deltaproteobacteria bacterium CG_4_9_14_3_um_filter_63_12]